MKKNILILIVILITIRILQQLLFRTQDGRSLIGESLNNEACLSLVKASTTPEEEAKNYNLSSYEDSFSPVVSSFYHLNTSNISNGIASSFFIIKRLNNSSKNSFCKIVVSIHVWKQFFTHFRLGILSKSEYLFTHLFDSSASNIVMGMLLGSYKAKYSNISHLFKVTGTQHLLAISGFHLSLIVSFCSGFYEKRISKSMSILTNLLVAGLYLCLVGFSFSLVRAFLMYSVSSLSLFFYRQKRALFIIFLTLIIVILIDISIINSVGFQLSFVATLGIILYSVLFRTKNSITDLYIGINTTEAKNSNFSLVGNTIKTYFYQSIIVSLVVQIAIFPLVAYYFQEISIFGIVVTALISWSIPIFLKYGILLLFGMIIFPIKILQIASLPLSFLVSFIVSILELFRFDWSLVVLPEFNIYYLIIYYLIIIFIYGLIFFIKNKKKQTFYEKKYYFKF